MNKHITLCCILFFNYSYSQIISNNTGSEYQFGFGIKTILEVQRFSNLRLSLSAGIGKKMKDDLSFIYPSINTELQIYNGGMGSSLMNKNKLKLNFDFVTSVSITLGSKLVNHIGYAKKFNPLYYFLDDSAISLQNPYHWSLSLGSNYIISSDSNKENQMVGLLNLNFGRLIQFTYINDGAPFGKLTGDGYDRYHTGGGMFSYHGNYTDAINLIEISYHRFTGYQRNSFEISNHMQIDFIPYKNSEAFYYNQSKWKFKLSNYNSGYGGYFAYYNSNLDGQDLIHKIIDKAYQPNLLKISRKAYGINYYYTNWNSK